MKRESTQSKGTSRRKAGKLKLKKETIKDLKSLDEKAEKIRGGFVPKCTADNTVCCDRNLKGNFAAVDVKDILTRLHGVSIQRWNYKIDDPSVSHIGPMAQDFAAAFRVGEDDKRIHLIDAAGVAFAAIQALFEMVRDLDAERKSLRSELNAMRGRMMAMDVA